MAEAVLTGMFQGIRQSIREILMARGLKKALKEIGTARTMEDLGRTYDQYCVKYLNEPFSVYRKLLEARNKRMEKLNKRTK